MQRPRHLKRIGWFAGAAVLLAVLGWFSLDLWVRQALDGAGVSWQRVQRSGLSWTVSAPRHALWRASSARLEVAATPRLSLRTLDLDLAAVLAGEGIAANLRTLPDWIYFSADPMTLRWGERILASGLRTRLQDGTLSATGPTLQARGAVGDGGVELNLDGALELEELGLVASARWSLTSPPRLQAEVRELRLGAPALSEQALRLRDLRLSLEGDVRDARGSVGLAATSASLDLACSAPDPRHCRLRLAMRAVPLAALDGHLQGGPHTAKVAALGGTFDFNLELDAAGARIDAAARELRARVAEFDPARFTQPFEYPGRVGGDGNGRRQGGPGSADWLARADMPQGFDALVVASLADAARQPRRLELGGLPLEVALAEDAAADPAAATTVATLTLLRTIAADTNGAGERHGGPVDTLLRDLPRAGALLDALGSEAVVTLLLNTLEWAPGVHGLGAAAQHYFTLPAAELDARQQAFLAALLPEPRDRHDTWFRARRPDRERIEASLSRMRNLGHLSAADEQMARQTRLWFEAGP